MYPCYIPVLGELKGSRSYKTYPLQKYNFFLKWKGVRKIFPRLPHDFFCIGYEVSIPRRANSVLRCKQHPRRDRGCSVHSPPQITLRSSGVNKLRPLRGRERWCGYTTASHLSRPASNHDAPCAGNADMRCGRGVNDRLHTAACESASASSLLSPPL